MASGAWLITGSSRGLGREIALAALEHGDQVVATARRPEQLADLVDRFGDRVRAVALDVIVEPPPSASTMRAADGNIHLWPPFT
jgi:NAD(P)-dependent dehydrogenase (short-subunit alcohol dehydrogenase family)